MDKLFDKEYSIEVQKLELGESKEDFNIGRSFFEAFEHSLVADGDLTVQADIIKYNTHLDVTFSFKGEIMLACDRCSEPYPYPLEFSNRVIFSYDESMEFNTDDVVLLDRNQNEVQIAEDLYDFINLQVPLRKVPEPEVHVCAPEVLKILGLVESEEAENEANEEEEIDPRWQKLRELKDKDNKE